MKSDEVVSVPQLVMGRRERAVILEPRDESIVLWSLRFGDEVRPEGSYFEDIDEEADPDLVPLVQKLIKQKSAHWSPDMVNDLIQTRPLLKLIEEKKKALKPKKTGQGRQGRSRTEIQCREHHRCGDLLLGQIYLPGSGRFRGLPAIFPVTLRRSARVRCNAAEPFRDQASYVPKSCSVFGMAGQQDLKNACFQTLANRAEPVTSYGWHLPRRRAFVFTYAGSVDAG